MTDAPDTDVVDHPLETRRRGKLAKRAVNATSIAPREHTSETSADEHPTSAAVIKESSSSSSSFRPKSSESGGVSGESYSSSSVSAAGGGGRSKGSSDSSTVTGAKTKRTEASTTGGSPSEEGATTSSKSHSRKRETTERRDRDKHGERSEQSDQQEAEDERDEDEAEEEEEELIEALCDHLVLDSKTRSSILKIAKFARARRDGQSPSVSQAQCQACKAEGYACPGVWVCIDCYSINCHSHSKHAENHAKLKQHPRVQNLRTFHKLGCFVCNQTFEVRLAQIEESQRKYSRRRKGRGGAADSKSDSVGSSSDSVGAVNSGKPRKPANPSSFAERITELTPLYDVLHGDMLWQKHVKGGRVGYVNMGNTCFMSASLQVLFHCPPIIHMFTQSDLLYVVRPNRIPLTHSFMELLYATWAGKYTTIRPMDFFRCLVQTFQHFRGYAQQDAHEFLRCLLDYLHEEFQYCVSMYDGGITGPATSSEAESTDVTTTTTSSISSASAAKSTGDEDSGSKKSRVTKKERSEEEEKKCEDAQSSSSSSSTDALKSAPKGRLAKSWKVQSVMSDLFGGEVISEVKCLTCDRRSETREIIYDISVQIPKNDQIDRAVRERKAEPLKKQGWMSSFFTAVGISSQTIPLDTCLHSYCTSEDLMHTEQYHCERCRKKVDARKSLSFSKIPEVLMIHIKRFEHTSGGMFWGGSSKLSTPVSFVMDGLDFTPYIHRKHVNDPSNRNCLYDLYGVVKHMGATGGGHYVAYARHPSTNEWYLFDDTRVSCVDIETVLKDQAYILVYCRRKDNHRTSESIIKMLGKDLLRPGKGDETAAATTDGDSGGDESTMAKKKKESATVDPTTSATEKRKDTPTDGEPSSSAMTKTKKKEGDEVSVETQDESGKIEVSRYWFHKLRCMSLPGSLDNLWQCCYHGFPLNAQHQRRQHLTISVDRSVWEALVRRFGLSELTPFECESGKDVTLHSDFTGVLLSSSSEVSTDDGTVVTETAADDDEVCSSETTAEEGGGGSGSSSAKTKKKTAKSDEDDKPHRVPAPKTKAKRLMPWEMGYLRAEHCPECSLQSLKRRRTFEMEEIRKLEAESRGMVSDCAVTMKWATTWRNFVHGKSDEVPGPLDNSSLVSTKPEESGLVRSDAVDGKDFMCLTVLVWKFLVQIYGGGPKLINPPESSPSSTVEEDAAEETASSSRKKGRKKRTKGDHPSSASARTGKAKRSGGGDPSSTPSTSSSSSSSSSSTTSSATVKKSGGNAETSSARPPPPKASAASSKTPPMRDGGSGDTTVETAADVE